MLTRRGAVPAIATGLALALAGCNSGNLGSLSPSDPPVPAPGPQAGAIGEGSVKVGLLLPLSAPGNGGVAANSLRNSAELALSQFQNANVQLLVRDDKGTAEGAANAAREVIAEGAELILGPLFAPSVQAAGQVARQASKPMIAFSTDSNVASRGVYLLSFMPETEVDRIIDYAYSQGRRSFAALIPDNSYGKVVEAQFQQAIARRGGKLAALERYPEDRNRLQEPVGRIGSVVGGQAPQADALFLPANADALAAIAPMLAQAGYDPGRVKPLGTGLWNDARAFSLPQIQGGWFAAPDGTGFEVFAAKYRQRFNSNPTRIGTLSYDAVSLIVALTRTQGSQRFSEQVLTNPSGFNGADGVFRFRPEGGNERGLAVLEVRGGKTVTVSPAPQSFSTGGGY